MKAVHFGAGSIGRGFIGELLHDSGYKTVLIDINESLINQINRDHFYELYIIEKNYEQKIIDKVTALSSIKYPKLVTKEITEADIITTSVGLENLVRVASVISTGLLERKKQKKEKINILACENAMFNSEILKKEILKLQQLSENELNLVAAFPNTAVDRLVLESKKNGNNVINIGVEHELVIEKNKMANPNHLPIKGAKYTDNLKKFIERKLYIVNCGHAWASYLGAIYGYEIMMEIFSDNYLVSKTKEAMMESAKVLTKKHDFSLEELQTYIDFVIQRFKTPGIFDTVNRVCRSPIQKLGPAERLVGPAIQCENRRLKNERLLEGIAAVFHFDNPDDQQSRKLIKYVSDRGILNAVTHYTGLEKESRMVKQIIKYYESMLDVKGEKDERNV
ncbi:mannitol-1-phosphate 5-dehydrogenase [Tetragenococcus halophilus subsp. flandriensis]|uniref:mannitol-1-phosphate 5-dehydrogenase n=1 Tax=Tetragenococcus halophilus TaxID=51669 RepID=UPI0023E93A2A|nr:mannitol-1-phosphate 5-dehydrogenase [Tetragenococcus halophilus]GMA08816.1 mannitol-1-phosphate 5-dehydrogenase [Tetragenococcus halophilus subsp. flandriensis]